MALGNNPFEVESLTVAYTANIELLLQQTMSRLRGLTDSGTHVGKFASPINQVGNVEFRAPGARFAPVQFQNPNMTRRWVSPTDRDCGVPVDTWDLLRTIVDPKSAYSQAVMAAANRFADQLIVDAAFATAKTGVDPGSLVDETWSTSYDVADTFGSGATSSGASYRKVVEGKRLMRHAEVPETEQLTWVVGSTQESEMLTQDEFINADYNGGKPVVVDGVVQRVSGVNIVVSERLAYGSSIRQTILFAKSGLYLGVWQDMTINITQRTDLSGQPWQLYAMLSMGATRTQLGKVIKIKCADAVTGPVV